MSKGSREPVRVTDHAVVRYLERVMGFDIDQVRAHIGAVCNGPAGLGASCVRAEGVKFELGNNTVVTVVPDHVTPGRTAQERNQHRIKAIAHPERGVVS